MEILAVDDGAKDNTANIADDYERCYPGIVLTRYKENGGHGDAGMIGMQSVTGL